MANKKTTVTKSKTQIKFDFKNMDKIFHREVHDMYGNEFHININANFKDPFFRQTIQYRGYNNGRNK